jgi:hypothetical protein
MSAKEVKFGVDARDRMLRGVAGEHPMSRFVGVVRNDIGIHSAV